MSNPTQVDILIVGAGLSGLMAATTIASLTTTPRVTTSTPASTTSDSITMGDAEAKPPSILLVDKGRSVGGRLATRRIGSGRADHGAQFMTVREPSFQQYVDSWLEAGVAYKWSDGWGPNFDGYPRYAIRNGFNTLGKHLASELMTQDVEIRVNTRLTSISAKATESWMGWQAIDEAGNVAHTKAVVLTSPVPQSLALLDAGNVALGSADRTDLEKLHYAPCLCGLFRIDGGTTFEEPGMAINPDDVVSWMADNQRKGISPDAQVVTVHAGPSYSSTNYDAAEADILPVLRGSLQPFLRPGTEIVEEQLKRWRYAQPLELYPERFLKAVDLPPLYFGGDIFGGPRVEGASLSGIAIGRSIGRSIGRVIEGLDT